MEETSALQHEASTSSDDNKEVPLMWDGTKFFEMKEALLDCMSQEKQDIEQADVNHFSLISSLRFDYPNVVVLNLTRAFRHHGDIQKTVDLSIICHLRTIEVLNLEGNGLCSHHLPKEIYNLANLHSLILSHNSINQLPASFLILNLKLEKLDVTYNRFSSLPASLLKLPCLKTVYRCGNRPMMDEYAKLSLEWAQRLETISVKTKRFHTLQALSVQTILSTFPGFPLPSVPFLIVRQFHEVMSHVTMCDHCSRAIDRDVVRLLLFPSDFCGLEYVPLSANLCSEACAEKFDTKYGKVCTNDEEIACDMSTIPSPTVVARKPFSMFTCCLGR